MGAELESANNATVACVDPSEWPDRDGEVTCGTCKYLVQINEFKTCSDYCQSFGQECFWAAEDKNVEGGGDNRECQIEKVVTCSDDIAAMQQNSKDMLCGCQNPESGGQLANGSTSDSGASDSSNDSDSSS